MGRDLKAPGTEPKHKSIVELFLVIAQVTYCSEIFSVLCIWQWLKSPKTNFGASGERASSLLVTSAISWAAEEAFARMNIDQDEKELGNSLSHPGLLSQNSLGRWNGQRKRDNSLRLGGYIFSHGQWRSYSTSRWCRSRLLLGWICLLWQPTWSTLICRSLLLSASLNHVSGKASRQLCLKSCLYLA